MVAVEIRRVTLRPKLEEPCPAWARDLIPLSQQEHGLGVARERVPQGTLDELAYYFPPPADPKRKRKREVASGREKPYTRTSGMVVYLGCLPFALAKQLDLFAPGHAEGPGEVAVLSFRKLADLARRLGISYDRLQRQMTVLLTLGFVWRFRSGRQLLYVIPLTAYRPTPSPEAIREKLTALIESQIVEEQLEGGTLVRRSRCPDFTDLLLEVRARFELRYQLEPSWPADMELLTGHMWEDMLRDMQQTLPHCTREELCQLVPIVARHLAQEGQIGATQGGGRRWVLRSTASAASLSVKDAPDAGRLHSGAAQHHRDSTGSMSGEDMTESRIDTQSRQIDGSRASSAAARRRSESTSDQRDQQGARVRHAGQSRFVAGQQQDATDAIARSQAALMPSDAEIARQTNLDFAATAGSLTLRVISSDVLPKEYTNGNVKDAQTPSGNLERDEEWCQAQGTSLARIFADPESLNYYVGVHRANGPELLQAVFIKTLFQASHGGFKKSAAAYFNFMLETWRVYRTYDAACAKWNKWGQKRDPKGIPPNIQKLVTLYRLDSYEQIAASMGYFVAQVGDEAWPTACPPTERPAHPMTGSEAEQLVERIQRQAAWYLQEAQVVREPAFGPDVYVVDARQDGSWTTFTSVEDWNQAHSWMLTPPAEYDRWLEATAQERWHALSGEEDGMSASDRERCLRAALALSAYLGWDLGAFSWQELVALGKPLAFPGWAGTQDQEEMADTQDPQDAEFREGEDGLQVRLDDGVLLTAATYEQAFQAGEAACAEEEWECSPEGAMALLQHQVLLGLQLCILHTCGLPMYLAFLAQTTASAAGEPEQGTHPEEDLPVSPARTGVPATVTLASFARLRRALAPRLYCVKWVPGSERQGGAIEVESLLSGTVFSYEQDAQVEDLLADLRAQLAMETTGAADLQHA